MMTNREAEELKKKPKVSNAALKVYDSLIPGRWYYTIGHFSKIKELLAAKMLSERDNSISWAKGPAVRRPKST